MSRAEIIIAGFGGQGILYLGQVLAQAACNVGRKVSWLPSYGPEMRGGTANCMVVISDREIYSPMVLTPDVLLTMNKPSLVRFENTVKPTGLVILNKDMIDVQVSRNDINQLWVQTDTIAKEFGNPKISNMVALGCLVGATGIIELDEVINALESSFPSNKLELVAENKEALRRGYTCAGNGGTIYGKY